MDPATLSLLIRLAGDVGVSLISILKALGRDDDATAIGAVLARSDDVWDQVQRRAEEALGL